MGKIFYTSDLHFGHKNILKYENRPWNSIEEMNEGLITRWNEKVTDNDDVYILGDFAFQSKSLPIDTINLITHKLKGKKHLIIGNHDEWINKIDVKPRLWASMDYYAKIMDKNRIVILSHYPIETWDQEHYGSIHLYGHLHSTPTKLYQSNRYNVGCDNWNYYPVTLDEIIAREGYTSIKE